MKLESITINNELRILYGCDNDDKKMSYIYEMVKCTGQFNKAIPEFLLNVIANDVERLPFVLGFILALKMVNEQEQINQENELERIFNLK